ncbi:MAG: hypothetical protein WBV23_04595 [Desulfobaccales bacterium]
MDGSKRSGVWEGAQKGPGPEEEKLDRALVNGLMLEVILETGGSSFDPKTQRQVVKKRLKDSLITHLAGRVTLDRFHRLLRKVDRWFPVNYPLVTGTPLKPSDPMGGRPQAALTPAPPALREDLLRAWFQEEGLGLLPRRAHRKLSRAKLWEFLGHTRGGWFRLKDFEQHFGIDRKTAWEYLQKLLRAGLLRHNQARSAAVRYALATRFLLVWADSLET